jgi:hypothetical protein
MKPKATFTDYLVAGLLAMFAFIVLIQLLRFIFE